MTSSYLNAWFKGNKRDFPWRDQPTPYRVWVSEVMLQQTRALVVVSYFERWMAAFPDIATLAAAPIEQVIKLWEGLGYYSRARNLHAGAQQIVRDFAGVVPSTSDELLKIKGLGPYTVAAIMNFGFKKRAAAVDGNVLRVISRYAWIDQDIQKQTTKKLVTAFVEEYLDATEPWVSSEALIELGATICTPKPRCQECPIQAGCKAFERDQVDALPIKSGGAKTIKLNRGVAVIESSGYILVREIVPGKIMEGLYEFPYFEDTQTFFSVQQAARDLCGGILLFKEAMATVKHTFTRYSATLYPFYFHLDSPIDVAGHRWMAREELKLKPFSSGHRKIMQQLEARICELF